MSKFTNLRDIYYQAVVVTGLGIHHNLGFFTTKHNALLACKKWIYRLYGNDSNLCSYFVREFVLSEDN